MQFCWKRSLSLALFGVTLLFAAVPLPRAEAAVQPAESELARTASVGALPRGAASSRLFEANPMALSGALRLNDTDEPPRELPRETPEPEATEEEPPADPFTILVPEHPGEQEKRNDKVVIDYSRIADGYFMVQRIVETDHRFKVLVKIKGITYNYNLDTGDWAAFPLSEGDGSYQVSIHENIYGTKYANVISVSFQAKITDPFAPFLRPNLHVNYLNAPKTMTKGAELTEGCEGPLQIVDSVFSFITENIHYDYLLAATVEPGYLPDLDRILSRKRGICYDYSSLMTAMLRSQNVPCKLVFGYVGKIYHAWISVWVEEEGWVQVIHFDGKSWQRMDPTFTAAGTSDDAVKKYVGNGKSYSVKYCF